MIKRNDLVKQFELVVKQEIKNHNDAISASNAALEALKQKHIELACKHSSNSSEISSLKTSIDIKDRENNISINNLSESTDSRFNNLSEKVDKLNSESLLSNSKISDLSQSVVCIKKEMMTIKSVVASVKDECDKIIRLIKDDLERHHYKACRNLKEMEDSIINRPSEALEVKEHLEKKIAEKDVMVTGIYENFDHFTKKTNYMEKKIEDLYNKLARLKT
jgi:phage shock protein A